MRELWAWFRLEWRGLVYAGSGCASHVLLAIGLVVLVFFSGWDNKLMTRMLWLTLFFVALHTGSMWSWQPKSFLLYAYTQTHPLVILWARILLHTLWLIALSMVIWLLYALWLDYTAPTMSTRAYLMLMALASTACVLSLFGTALAKMNSNTPIWISLLCLPLLLPIWLLCMQLDLSPLNDPIAKIATPTGVLIALFSACSLLFPYLWKE